MLLLNNTTLLESLSRLRAGQEVLFSGSVYTLRDQAHKRLLDEIRKKKTPFDLRGQVIYYCGPTKTPAGKIIGSCGPTTSRRMDPFSPALLKRGIKAMIGKGGRSQEVIDAIRKHKAIYFLAPAGCGALLATKVKKTTPIAYADLGPEAVYKYEVDDFPLIVGIDSKGQVMPGLMERK